MAANAHYIGIEQVVYRPQGRPLMVRADEHSLEDVVTHVLRNAQRHRRAGTPIDIGVVADAAGVTVSLHNQGPSIDAGLLERIFEYGVSDAPDSTAQGQRGQGLFVARTYMAKMGGTISAANDRDGVTITLVLARLPG